MGAHTVIITKFYNSIYSGGGGTINPENSAPEQYISFLRLVAIGLIKIVFP